MQNKTLIVILHHKGELVLRCLESLKDIKSKKIIVTSDLRFCTDKCLWVYNSRNEPTWKRNWGAKLAESEYICFLDDDVEVLPNTILTMEELLDTNDDIGMIYAHLFKMDNHDKVDTSGSYMTWNGFLHETYNSYFPFRYILSGKSACCMIRRDIFEKIGGFDEDFVIYGEETDLSWRVWLEGYSVVLFTRAIAYHAFETPLKPLDYYNRHYIHYHGSKNYITMLIKNLPTSRLYIVGLNALIWLTMAILMLPRNRKATKWILQGLWYNIRNIRYIWGKRGKADDKTRQKVFRRVYRNPGLKYYVVRCKEYLCHRLHG